MSNWTLPRGERVPSSQRWFDIHFSSNWAGAFTFSVSAKKILTVQSKRATARSRWSGLYRTPRTSSDIFSVRT